MMDTAQQFVRFSTTQTSLHPEQADAIEPEPASVTWQAFRAGMHILTRCANHAAVDFNQVRTSNLRLLHRTLSRQARYTGLIKKIKQEAETASLPIIRRLHTEQTLTADLILLQDGGIINLSVLPQYQAMYLLISGNAQLESTEKTSEPVLHWWQKIRNRDNSNTLRSGAVIIPSYEIPQDKLRAVGKQSLLLRINTLNLETTCKVAS